MSTVRFGDIYTNGLNYWMVVSVSQSKCGCDCHPNRHELRPVVLDDEKNPSYFVGHYDGQVRDIKPRSWLYKRATFLHSPEEPN